MFTTEKPKKKAKKKQMLTSQLKETYLNTFPKESTIIINKIKALNYSIIIIIHIFVYIACTWIHYYIYSIISNKYNINTSRLVAKNSKVWKISIWIDKHSIKFWTFLLTFNTVIQSFDKTFWFMMKHHQTRFGYKRISSSADGQRGQTGFIFYYNLVKKKKKRQFWFKSKTISITSQSLKEIFF